MDGIIFDIKRYALHDGPGIRTTVFFKGCPLNCQWCHNPESIKSLTGKDSTQAEIFGHGFHCKSNQGIGWKISADALLQEVLKDQMYFDESGGGVTFSGGEPFMQNQFLSELADRCRSAGIHLTVDTSGFVETGIFNGLIRKFDLVLYDLKLIGNDLHKKYTGVDNDLILGNLRYVSRNRQNIRIRIPLIPEITDTDDNLSQIINFLIQNSIHAPIDLLPFNVFSNQKYHRFNMENRLGELTRQDEHKLNSINEKFERAGFKAKIGG